MIEKVTSAYTIHGMNIGVQLIMSVHDVFLLHPQSM